MLLSLRLHRLWCYTLTRLRSRKWRKGLRSCRATRFIEMTQVILRVECRFLHTLLTLLWRRLKGLFSSALTYRSSIHAMINLVQGPRLSWMPPRRERSHAVDQTLSLPKDLRLAPLYSRSLLDPFKWLLLVGLRICFREILCHHIVAFLPGDGFIHSLVPFLRVSEEFPPLSISVRLSWKIYPRRVHRIAHSEITNLTIHEI